MSSIVQDITEPPPSAFLSYGFRPFFLIGALWAIGSLAIWILALASGFEIPSRFDPMSWHIHEMLFGFVMAAIAGFLLTAIPNWTGRPPISGLPLAGLVVLWILGRIAVLSSAMLPTWLAIATDLAFPAALIAAASREIVAGRNWRNLLMLIPVSLFGLANLLMHAEALGWAVPVGLGWRLGLGAVIALIALVGGRIVPSFTRNWLMKRGRTVLPAPFGWVDRVALLALVLGFLCWAVRPDFWGVGLVLLTASGLHFWRLSRWKGHATAADPLLAILHVAYAWLAIGTGLLGLSVLDPGVPESAAIHALTAGAAATMILAVMTRATRGHTGRELVADRATSLVYLMVNLAAVMRVIATFASDWNMALLNLSAFLWFAAFALFVCAYGNMLVSPSRK
jgi:uncharacterized protein involved in response to NO